MDANYQLQIKPFERKEGVKYKVIKITDIQLHTNKMDVSTSIGNKVKKSFELKRPGRIYEHISKLNIQQNGQVEIIADLLKNDQSFLKYVQEEEKNGYKILLGIPETGIPVLTGKDTQEFIGSKKGKRILRWFNKKKDNMV